MTHKEILDKLKNYNCSYNECNGNFYIYNEEKNLLVKIDAKEFLSEAKISDNTPPEVKGLIYQLLMLKPNNNKVA